MRVDPVKVELLAPAGDREKLEAAIRFGADAVYLGGPSLQLRAGETAFSLDSLLSAIEFAHTKNKRVYVAVNAFANNESVSLVGDYAKALYDLQADAVIVSDLGVLAAMRRAAPALSVHISTQANCLNYEAARAYHDLGASRIVLGREMTIGQIAELRAKTPPALELEAFIHGAMCMAYSGRCMISAHLTGRSANSGDCTQSCRWRYHLVEETRPGQYFPVCEDDDQMAILSAHDLNCIDILSDLIDAGVTSLKIEGRMKSPYYVATVTNAYRHALLGGAPLHVLKKELDSVSHRPYSTGFYLEDERVHQSAGPGYLQGCKFVGVVKNCASGRMEIEQRNRIREGDVLEVLSPDAIGLSFTAKEICDASGAPITEIPRPLQRATMACPYTLRDGDLLRVRMEEIP